MRVGKRIPDKTKRKIRGIASPRSSSRSNAGSATVKITKKFLKEIKRLGLGRSDEDGNFIDELYSQLTQYAKVTLSDVVWAANYCYRFSHTEMGDRLVALCDSKIR